MIKKMTQLFALAAMAALSAPAIAQGNDHVDTETGSFAEQRAKVEADLADGETYSEISMEDRSAVVRELDRIEALLRGRPVSELHGAEKNEVMNAQALINNKLTRAGEDSRMVCKREAKAGTRLVRSQCLTVAQRRRARESAQDMLDRTRPQVEDFNGF
jgi:hypothetical protein